jgi:transposase
VKVQRARIAVALQDNPQASNTELCDMTGAHRSTVQRWRKRWTRHGFALDDAPRSGRPPAFSPLQLAQIKAVACEVPFRLNLPFSRLSLSELQGYVKEQQIVEHLSIGALWNLLNQDAIRPWYHRSWIFPRDPLFVEKAAPELDLYQGQWEERCLRAGEHVVCLDMKSSIQARARCRGSVPPHPGHGQLVEHEYERQGALNLIACLDERFHPERHPMPQVFGIGSYPSSLLCPEHGRLIPP